MFILVGVAKRDISISRLYHAILIAYLFSIPIQASDPLAAFVTYSLYENSHDNNIDKMLSSEPVTAGISARSTAINLFIKH